MGRGWSTLKAIALMASLIRSWSSRFLEQSPPASLKCARVQSAVQQNALAGNVPCMLAAQEGAGLSEFQRSAKTFCRNGILSLRRNCVFGAPCTLRRRQKALAQAFGVKISWKQIVDCDVLMRDGACDTCNESGQACTRGARQF